MPSSGHLAPVKAMAHGTEPRQGEQHPLTYSCPTVKHFLALSTLQRSDCGSLSMMRSKILSGRVHMTPSLWLLSFPWKKRVNLVLTTQ